MVKNTYEILTELEASGLLKKSLNKGLISMTIFSDFILYKDFLKSKKEGKKVSIIVSDFSIQENISERKIYRIMARMTS